MSEHPEPSHLPRRIQFAISTLVMAVLVLGAMLGFQMKTSWSFGESLVGILMIVMAAFCIADIVNWCIKRISMESTTMSDKPKRRFWQLHLSTLIVLSFVAGGLLWLNLKGGEWRYPAQRAFTLEQRLSSNCCEKDYGWPLTAAVVINMDGTENFFYYLRGYTALDTITAFAILLLCAACCEWLARRSKPSP